jgi:proline-specific peptidase
MRIMRAFLFSCAIILWGCLAYAQQQTQTSRLAKGDHFADVNGVQIWYTIVGSGPLLVVQAPGWGPNSAYLRIGLSPLSEHFTLLFYETRGSGHSSRPEDSTKMGTSDMVNDLEALRQYWGLKAMTLMGHSHGGAIALGYALRYPRHVRKLILVDTSIPGYEAEAEVKKMIDARRNDSRFTEAIAEMRDDAPQPKTDEEFRASLNRWLPLFFYDPDKNMPRYMKTLSGLPAVWAYDSINVADAKAPMHVLGSMDRIHAGTLILVGREDFICPPPVAERIHAEIKKSKLLVFEKTGHFPWIEDADEFFEEVVGFASDAATGL